MRKIPGTVEEYLAVAHRRWRLFLIPLFIVPLLVFAVSRRLPRSYSSTSTVLIQTQIAPKGLVDDSMQNDVKDRFEAISNLILSQSRLLHIVDQLGLYKLPGVSSREEAVAKLRKNLTIEMESERVERSGSGLFKISYVAPTPELAQEVTREVADLSISGNLESREQQALGNVTFIQDELDRALAELKVKEQRLNFFRAQHSEIIPAQAAATMQTLGQNQTLETANAAAIERVDDQQASIQALIDTEAASHTVSPASPLASSDPLVLQKREELRIARQRYTEKHPDVQRLESELDTLQHRPQAVSSNGTPIPSIMASQRQLQSQLITAAAELRTRQQRQATIERRIQELSRRAQVSPEVAGEGLQLQNDYEAAQKYYSSLVDKQHASALTANLEKSRGHDLVQVLDSANFPRRPDSPNFRLIYLAGLGLGLVLGIALALGVELMDQTFHDQNDLAIYLDSPMIAIIPTFNE
ncbi:MAG: GNVR domain-containing protein [Granulicella sp.]